MEDCDWLKQCLVGRVHDMSHVMSSKEAFIMHIWFQLNQSTIRVCHLGDCSFLLSRMEGIVLKDVVEKDMIKKKV